MTMIPVDSSLIKAIGYDENSQTLRVHFKASNSVYEYSGASKEVFDKIMGAESKGKALREEVINGDFTYCKITNP